MEKRYQVFVSSTFADLIDERRAVMQALLELDCIPAGMELFPAADEDAWTLIKRVIDDCDYYLVIVAGRYGSTDDRGLSYTEKEYDYAVGSGKPVLGFLHADPECIPAKYTDRDPELERRLAAFRLKVQHKLCKFWKTPAELGTAITTSCVKLIRAHPAEGWVKSRFIKTTEDAEKVSSLLEQVLTLQKELDALRRLGVADTSGLAQGEDPVRLEFSSGKEPNEFVDTTWNAVFARIGKACLELPTDYEVGRELWKISESADGYATQRCIDIVKAQFFCLGLIRITGRVQSEAVPQYTGSGVTYFSTDRVSLVWELTDYGRTKLGELIAAKRPEALAAHR